MRKSGRSLLSGAANAAACVGPGVLTVTQVKNALRTAPFASARPVLASKRGPVRMTFKEQIENDLLLFFSHHHAGVIWRGAAVGIRWSRPTDSGFSSHPCRGTPWIGRTGPAVVHSRAQFPPGYKGGFRAYRSRRRYGIHRRW